MAEVTRELPWSSFLRALTPFMGLLWWLSGKESAANARDTSSIPESGWPPGEGNDNPFQFSCLGNPMNRNCVCYSPWGCKRVRHDWVTKQQQQHSHHTGQQQQQLQLPDHHIITRVDSLYSLSHPLPRQPFCLSLWGSIAFSKLQEIFTTLL